MIIFYDLDWTLADCRHRLITFEGKLWRPGIDEFSEGLIDWSIFNEPERMIEDTVFESALDVAQRLAGEGHSAVYVTSREHKTHRVCVEWLWKNGFPYGPVHCCTPDGCEPVFSKEDVLAAYRDDIEKLGAVMYDDDWSGELAPVTEKLGIRHFAPDYVLGRNGFWVNEIARLEENGWNPLA